MQVADTNHSPGLVEVVGPSLALDLSWCIHAIFSSDYLREKHAVLGRLYDQHGELCERARGFWADDMGCFTDIQVLAHHANAIDVTDFSVLRARCEATLPSLALDMRLTSETEEDRATILARLVRLQESEELRDNYFDLLGDLWSPVADWWQGEGAPSVEASVAELRRSLARGAKWYEIMSSECSVFIQHLPDIIERNETGQPVVLVGCALFGKGLYLDLPGCTLVGFGAARPVDLARARTEHVVAPLRALGDPTRLAIFEYLTRGPAGVTDIAADFSLSQPTVSVHIKRLREAGLVSAVRRGNRLELSVESSTAAKLADDLGRLLTKAPASVESSLAEAR